MNKIEFALRLSRDCTYADTMMFGAKEHLRGEIDAALLELKSLEKAYEIKCNDVTVEENKCKLLQEQFDQLKEFNNTMREENRAMRKILYRTEE